MLLVWLLHHVRKKEKDWTNYVSFHFQLLEQLVAHQRFLLEMTSFSVDKCCLHFSIICFYSLYLETPSFKGMQACPYRLDIPYTDMKSSPHLSKCFFPPRSLFEVHCPVWSGMWFYYSVRVTYCCVQLLGNRGKKIFWHVKLIHCLRSIQCVLDNHTEQEATAVWSQTVLLQL